MKWHVASNFEKLITVGVGGGVYKSLLVQHPAIKKVISTKQKAMHADADVGTTDVHDS